MAAIHGNRKQLILTRYLMLYAQFVQCQVVPDLNIMGFLPMTGTIWYGGGACLPAIEIAMGIVNERTDILNGYNLRYMYKDTECDPGVATNIMYEMLYEPPVKHLISGPGCSLAAEATARSSYMWNMTHLSWAGGSPLLSDEDKYPRFFGIVPSDAFYNVAKVALLRYFNWKKVATITVALDYFFAVTDDFMHRTEGTDIDITTEIFKGDPTPRVRHLKALDARIIFASGYENHARQILCAAYKTGLYGPMIVWFFPNWYSDYWWRRNLQTIGCTIDEMDAVAEGLIFIGQFNEHPDTDEKGNAGISPREFQEMFHAHEKYRPDVSIYDWVAGQCFDSMWAAALTLNCSDAYLKETGHEKSLGEFDYSDSDIADVITSCTKSLSFVGIAGRVDFANGNTHKAIQMVQVIDLEPVYVGMYDNAGQLDNITKWRIKWIGDGINWRGGYVPRDSTHANVVEVKVPLTLYVVLSCFAAAGIVLSILLFIFNIYYRNNVYVKMSSPNINNILLLGCMCTYSTVFLQSYTHGSVALCTLRTFAFTLGFSMAYGALFSKTWRVYKIFGNRQLLRLKIHDRQLIGIVGILLAVLTGVLVLRVIIDPVTMKTTFLKSVVYNNVNDATVDAYLRHCVSRHESYFMWAIYSIKGVLLLFGAFLSFETRKVKIAALNDSRLIGLCLYNVFVLAAIGLTMSLILHEQVTLSYGIISGVTIIGTTATQLIIFIPKMTTMFYPHIVDPEPIPSRFAGRDFTQTAGLSGVRHLEPRRDVPTSEPDYLKVTTPSTSVCDKRCTL